MNTEIIIIDENDTASIPGHTNGFWAVAMVDHDNVHVVTGLDSWSAKEVAEAMAGYDCAGELETEDEYYTVQHLDADDIITEHMEQVGGFWHWFRDEEEETAKGLTTAEGRALVADGVYESVAALSASLFSEDVLREAARVWVSDGADLLAEREQAA